MGEDLGKECCQVDGRLRSLDAVISELESTTKSLCTRLERVTGAQPEKEKIVNETSPSVVPLAVEIEIYTMRINLVNETLSRQLGTLEI